MQTVFADSFYFFALGNRHDPVHGKCIAFNQKFSGHVVTTGFILTELMDGCSGTPSRRAAAIQAVDELRGNPDVTIRSCSELLFQRGLELFERRLDKEWSLTDCISFVVMTNEGIDEALTGDHHFEQAGFIALLR